MIRLNAFPPIRHHFKRRVTPSEAHAYVTSYLEAADEDATLHSNAFLTEDGPKTVSTEAIPAIGLLVLQRLAKGLAGERMSPDQTLDNDNDNNNNNDKVGAGRGEARYLMELAAIAPEGAGLTGGEGGQEQEECSAGATIAAGGNALDETQLDWQDRSEFEREQEVIQGGEIGPERNAIAENVSGVPHVKVADKEARKKMKLERRVKRRQEKEEKRNQRRLEKEEKRNRKGKKAGKTERSGLTS